MNCREASARLVALLDDELAPSEAQQVCEHLERCSACQDQHERLARTMPRAPVIALDAAQRHAMHLHLERALERAEASAPPLGQGRLGGLRAALFTEVGVPRGLVVLYAAALLIAVGWAAGRSMPSVDSGTVASADPVPSPIQVVDAHRPAAYTPVDGWF